MQKGVGVLLLVSVFKTNTNVAQYMAEYQPGLLLVQNILTSNSQESTAEYQCKNGTRHHCEGCHRRLVCDYEGNVLRKMDCPQLTPFCNDGNCETIPSKYCTSLYHSHAKKSDLCPGTGFYPDPIQCNQFNYCDEKQYAITYKCPNHYVYDPKTSLCKLYQTLADCPFIDCRLFPNQFLSYALDSMLYVFCNVDNHGNTRALLYKCSDKTLFNPLTSECEYGCLEGEGRYEYPGDDSKYYHCVSNVYGTIVPFVTTCSNGLKFINGQCRIKQSNFTIEAK